jgi:transcriptional regulator with XRE-family HTH domain
MVLYRTALGYVLKDVRGVAGLTLREVSANAAVALGYLSEVERGQKEISSELLASVAPALGTTVSEIVFRTYRVLQDWEEQAQEIRGLPEATLV